MDTLWTLCGHLWTLFGHLWTLCGHLWTLAVDTICGQHWKFESRVGTVSLTQGYVKKLPPGERIAGAGAALCSVSCSVPSGGIFITFGSKRGQHWGIYLVNSFFQNKI